MTHAKYAGSLSPADTTGPTLVAGRPLCQVNREFQLVGLFCLKLLGECNFEVRVLVVLCQAIEDVQLLLPQAIGDSCLCQAIGELPFAGVCAASSHWEFQCAGSCKLLGDLRFAGFCVVSSFWRFQLARHCFAPSYFGIMLKTPLIWRDRFIIFLKHAPSFGDRASSCIFNTPFHVAIPAHHISSTRSLLWSFPLIVMFKTLLMWRFRFIIYLKHPPLPLRAKPLHHIIELAPSSHIWNTHPHLPIPILRFFAFAKCAKPAP